MIRDVDDGAAALAGDYTVGVAVDYWPTFGLSGRDPHTIDMYRSYAKLHMPALGSAGSAN
jgi:hypothetical protein